MDEQDTAPAGEPDDAAEYVCPRCARGQCARCRDADCTCCGGGDPEPRGWW